MLEGIFVEGCIYALMVLGVFITFRILDFPDLTVDGTFTLGGALAAFFIVRDYNLWVALGLSFAGGCLAGAVTSAIHTRLKVPGLLAGILTMTMLYSINIRIMGNRSNVSLLNRDTLISDAGHFFGKYIPEGYAELIFVVIAALVMKFLIDIFFRTDMGLTMRALGDNEQMVVSQGVNPSMMKLAGVAMSNGLVAMSGALAAQYQGFADVNMGQGIIIIGLASVMIGEQIIRKRSIMALTLCALIGSIVYKGIMFFGRSYGYMIYLTPTDLKLITGVIIVILLIATKADMLKKAVGLRR